MQYAMEDLIRAANEAGYSPTARLVHDWVALGLLGRPERHGRGRRKGVSATWPEAQLQLFLTLLHHRLNVTRVGVLCNVPVWTWLYFGDEHVTTRQVRRALGTWGGSTSKVSWTTAKRVAHQLLDDAAHPQARRADKRELVETAASAIMDLPRKLDEEKLLPLFERVADPTGSGLTWTMDGMAVTPGAVVAIMRARVRGLAALAAGEVDDSLLHWARYAEIVSRAQYAAQLARMMGHGTRSVAAAIPTVQETVLRACADLCTLLGLGVENPGDEKSQSLDQPAVWKVANLRSVVHGQVIGDEVKVAVEVRPGDEAERSAPE